MTKMTITDQINAITFDTLTEEQFDFLVERAHKSVRKGKPGAVRKPTKTQRENEGLRANILNILTADGMTAKQVGDHFGLATQKVSPQLNALVDAGLAIKVKEGKVTLFKVAE